MRSITINKNDAGQRIDKFLLKTFKNLPASMMYKQIRQKNIKLNGKRCIASEKIFVGDVLTLYIKEEFFEKVYSEYDFLKAPNKIDVIYEDENILLINKKAGLIVHPDENYHFDSLISRVQHHLYQNKKYDPAIENSFAPALVNRIDRNTCGIVIIAKNAESLKILNEKIKTRQISKFYLCIVHGIINQKTAVMQAYLKKDEKKKQVYISNKKSENSKTIKTKYKVLSTHKGTTLLEVELLTGRTHQIRAHMAYVGHPIVGDGKYGRDNPNSQEYKYQALCSYKLVFDFQTDAGILNYLKNKTFELSQIPFVTYSTTDTKAYSNSFRKSVKSFTQSL